MFLFTAVLRSQAQVFAGAGFSGTPISDLSIYGVGGFSLMLEKDFNLSKSTRWKMHPALHVSFLFSQIDRPLSPSYLNVISVSPKISYEVISGKGVKVAPYASPFVSKLWGVKGIIFGSDPIDTFRYGLEGGVRIDIMLRKATIRFIPFSIQMEKEGLYAQVTMFALLLSL